MGNKQINMIQLVNFSTMIHDHWISLQSSLRLLTSLLFFSLITKSQAQVPGDFNVANQLTYIDFLPPTPAVASLSDFSRIGGGLSSGSAQFNVPLTSINLNGVAVPVALNYSSTGIKVDDLASRVGMGWQLNAGGSISRVMQGALDENARMLLIPQNKLRIEFYDYINNALAVKPQSNFDNQPDLFSFDVCGLRGKFYLNDNNEAVLFPKSNLSITTNFSGIDHTFIITDVHGNKFFLGGEGYIEKSKRQGSGSKPFYEFYPTAWFLRKIEPYNGGEITFHYEEVNYIYEVGLNQTMYYTYTYLPDACDRSCPQLSPDVTINYVQTKTYFLDSIHSVGRSLKFKYVNRQDYLNEVLLKEIVVFEHAVNSKVIEVFDFTIDEIYSTSYSNSIADLIPRTRYRPFLKKITKVAGTMNHVVNSFEYNTPEALPVRLSFSQDHWGYFNGRSNSSFVPKPELYSSDLTDNPQERFQFATANREVNEDAAIIGMIKKITYPTQGYDVIEYETNKYDTSWTVKPSQDTVLRYSRINTTGNNYTEAFELIIHFAQEVRFEISVDDLQLSQVAPIKSGSINLYNDENVLLTSAQEIIWDLHDPNAGKNNQTSVSIYLPAGTYHGTFSCLGKVKTDGEVIYTPGNLIAMEGDMPVGGVRIKSIKGYSHDHILLDEKHYKYCSSADTTKSSLNYFRHPVYSKIQKSFHACGIYDDFTMCQPLYCELGIMYSSSIVNFSPFSGNHILYSHVIEYNGPTMNNGFVEHEYFTTRDEEGTVIYGTPIIGAPRSNTSVVTQNREKATTVYRKYGNGFKPIKRTQYEFSYTTLFDQIEGTVVNRRGDNCVGGIPTDPPSPEHFEYFEVTSYKLFSPWTVLKSVREELFTTDRTDSLVCSTVYEYANTLSKLPTKVITTGSDGKVTMTINKFVNDTLDIPLLPRNQVAPLGKMANHNLVTPLIHQEKFVNGNKVSEYRALYADHLTKVYPSKVSQFAVDGTEIESFEFMYYDANGNITQRRKNDGIIYSYLWDNQNQFLLAEIKGAEQMSVAATSFESTGFGNWIVTGGITPVFDRTSPTGSHYGKFNTGGALVKNGLNPSTSYLVSYWYLPGTVVTVSGNSNIVTLTGRNGWVNARKKVTGESAVTISVSADSCIDEVRVYPEDSEMTTFTFDYGRGSILTVTDTNDTVTYYSYDPLGRLITVQDAKGNLLKTNHYHYINSNK